MALYAIGDLHLSFGSNKPMDIFGKKWDNHAEKLAEGFSVLQPEDICVICGDLSWAMNMDKAMEDFLFIDRLPGRKIILKGNHDYWWSTVSKAKAAFAKSANFTDLSTKSAKSRFTSGNLGRSLITGLYCLLSFSSMFQSRSA